MKKILLSVSLIGCLLAGCAGGTRLIPGQTPDGRIDQKTGEVTIEKGGITITAQPMDWNYFPYNLTNYFTPFNFIIKNETGQVLSFDMNNFFMYDEHKTQFNAFSPKDVYNITSGELYYLIPYPYVGVYLYEGYREYPTAGFREYPPIGVAGPQLYEIYPRDVYTQALPFGTLNQGARLKGLVYFKANLSYLKNIKVIVKATRADGQVLEFEFPYGVK